jgi:polyribonucleotide nucleotidyltransferase
MSLIGTRLFRTAVGSTELAFEVGGVAQRADSSVISQVRTLTSDAEIGKIYRGTVVGTHHFGTIARLFGSVEGLLPPDEADSAHGPVGSRLLVRTMGVDERGRIVLSAVTNQEVNPNQSTGSAGENEQGSTGGR